MKIPFTKMQGLGNDFVVLNFVDSQMQLSSEQFAQIADRRLGIGCDQILIVERSDQTDIDFGYRIVNADGSEVGQCGNGARCLIKFIRQQGLTDKKSLRISTCSSVMELHVNDDGSVTVDMGKVSFKPKDVPFIVDQLIADQLISDQQQKRYSITLEGSEPGINETIDIAIANVGNPHCLVLVDDIDKAPVELVGRQLESHPRFPEKVNVNFMQMVSPSEINLRVYERGAGETMACGSGACATVAMAQELGLLTSAVTVNLLGGSLNIYREIEDSKSNTTNSNNILMTGAAEFSFTGEITL